MGAYLITINWGVVRIVHMVAHLRVGRDLGDSRNAQNFLDAGKRWGGM